MDKKTKRKLQIDSYNKLLYARARASRDMGRLLKQMKAEVRLVLQGAQITDYSTWKNQTRVMVKPIIKSILMRYRAILRQGIATCLQGVYLQSARDRLKYRDRLRLEMIRKARKKEAASPGDNVTDYELLQDLEDDDRLFEPHTKENHTYFIVAFTVGAMASRRDYLGDDIDHALNTYWSAVDKAVSQGALMSDDADAIGERIEAAEKSSRVDGAIEGQLTGPWKAAEMMGASAGGGKADEIDEAVGEALGVDLEFEESGEVWQAYTGVQKSGEPCDYCRDMSGMKREDAEALGAYIPPHPGCFCQWVLLNSYVDID
jgi:hypothetical protein